MLIEYTPVHVMYIGWPWNIDIDILRIFYQKRIRYWYFSKAIWKFNKNLNPVKFCLTYRDKYELKILSYLFDEIVEKYDKKIIVY